MSFLDYCKKIILEIHRPKAVDIDLTKVTKMEITSRNLDFLGGGYELPG